MKIFFSLILVFASFLTGAQSEAKGCDGPLYESVIEANTYSIYGEIKPDDWCVDFLQFQYTSFYTYFNTTQGSNDSTWIFYIQDGEKLIVESRFVSQAAEYLNPTGYITVHSGEFDTLEIAEFSRYNDGSSYTGYNYTLEITKAIEFEITSPVKQNTVNFIVKVIEPDPIDDFNSELPFISHVGNSNEVLITTNSETVEEIDVYTISGNLVRRFTIENGQKIQLADLPKGIYLLTSEVNGNTLKGKYTRL